MLKPSADSQQIDGLINDQKLRLGDIYEKYSANILFTVPSSFVSPKFRWLAPIHGSTSDIIREMIVHRDRIQGETVVFPGAGTGLPARVAFALGARRVILVDNNSLEMNLAKHMMINGGHRESLEPHDSGDFVIVEHDLNDPGWLDVVKKYTQAGIQTTAAVNIGSHYGALHLLVVDMLAEMGTPFIFNSGFIDDDADSFHPKYLRAFRALMRMRNYHVTETNVGHRVALSASLTASARLALPRALGPGEVDGVMRDPSSAELLSVFAEAARKRYPAGARFAVAMPGEGALVLSLPERLLVRATIIREHGDVRDLIESLKPSTVYLDHELSNYAVGDDPDQMVTMVAGMLSKLLKDLKREKKIDARVQFLWKGQPLSESVNPRLWGKLGEFCPMTSEPKADRMIRDIQYDQTDDLGEAIGGGEGGLILSRTPTGDEVMRDPIRTLLAQIALGQPGEISEAALPLFRQLIGSDAAGFGLEEARALQEGLIARIISNPNKFAFKPMAARLSEAIQSILRTVLQAATSA
jgi:hypothetical protein